MAARGAAVRSFHAGGGRCGGAARDGWRVCGGLSGPDRGRGQPLQAAVGCHAVGRMACWEGDVAARLHLLCAAAVEACNACACVTCVRVCGASTHAGLSPPRTPVRLPLLMHAAQGRPAPHPRFTCPPPAPHAQHKENLLLTPVSPAPPPPPPLLWMQHKENLRITVEGANNGGLLSRISGLSLFVPVSQLERKGNNEWWTEQVRAGPARSGGSSRAAARRPPLHAPVVAPTPVAPLPPCVPPPLYTILSRVHFATIFRPPPPPGHRT